jgi:DNA-binding transcriptional LysR family regulator
MKESKPKKRKADRGLSDAELDIAIDEHRLDEEWVRQPRLYHVYSLKTADARWAMDQAKAHFELVQAELDAAIRDDPLGYGLEKISEVRLAACIVKQPEYLEALEALNNARHKVQVFQAAVSALDHKKGALENLVKLRLAEYYSDPKSSPSDRDAVEEMEKREIRRKKRVRDDG